MAHLKKGTQLEINTEKVLLGDSRGHVALVRYRA